VHDPLAVQVARRPVRVLEEPAHVGLGEALAGAQSGRHARPLDFLHHEVEDAVFLEVLDVAGQGAVRERREDPRLALGELHVLPCLGAADVEPLHGHEAAVPLVDGLERGALRALPEGAHDDVPPIPKDLLDAHGVPSA
jgi:hypothetical protein